MKRIIKILIIAMMFLYISSIVSACENFVFNNWSICIDIKKIWDNHYKFDTVSDLTLVNSIKCWVLLSDWYYHDLSNNTCWGSFNFNWNWLEKIKIYITVNNTYKTRETFFDFSNLTWSSWSLSNWTFEKYKIFLEDNKIYTNSEIKISVYSVDLNWNKVNYDWKIKYSIQKYYNSTWHSIVSDFYIDQNEKYFNLDNHVNNYISFNKEWIYRVVVEDYNWSKKEYSDIINVLHSSNVSTWNSANYTWNSWYNDNEIFFNIAIENKKLNRFETIKMIVYSTDKNNNLKKYTWKVKYDIQTFINWKWYDVWSDYYFIEYDSNDFQDVSYIRNYIKFKKKWKYRILVSEYYDEKIKDYSDYIYVEYSQTNQSSIDGFTEENKNQLYRIYGLWNNLKKSLIREYPILKSYSSWEVFTNDIYTKMWNTILKKTNWYSNYDDFFSDIVKWYRLTVWII